jgi:hypothetical protein
VLNTWTLVFISRRDAGAMITPGELGVAEG